MKPFIYSVIFLLGLQTPYFGQTSKTILKKSFSVKENTVLDLDVDNTVVYIEESEDNRLHVHYSIAFGAKYSKNSIQRKIDKISANFYKQYDSVNIDVDNSMELGELYDLHEMVDDTKIPLFDYFKKHVRKKHIYKSTDSIISEIQFSNGNEVQDFVRKYPDKYLSKEPFKAKKAFDQKLIVSLPKQMKIKLKATHSKVFFNIDIGEPIKVQSFRSYLKFKKIKTKSLVVSSYFGTFQSERITSGSLKFNNVKHIVIGELDNSKISTNGSKLQIGNLGKNNAIEDFDSKIYVYNYDRNFNSLNFKGDYSEVNLFKVFEDNFNLNVLGTNTTLIMKGNETKFGDDNIKESTKILEKKAKTGKPILGNIKLNLSNAVLEIK